MCKAYSPERYVQNIESLISASKKANKLPTDKKTQINTETY